MITAARTRSTVMLRPRLRRPIRITVRAIDARLHTVSEMAICVDYDETAMF